MQDPDDEKKNKRSTSARSRKTSRKFVNSQKWQCETYRVTAQNALTGRIIGTWETNDLAKVTVVHGFVGQVLGIFSDRVALCYKGDAVGSEDQRSLYTCVEFNREPIFHVSIRAPRRCMYCRYISGLGYGLRGSFERIAEYDYRFNAAQVDETEEIEPITDIDKFALADSFMEIKPNSDTVEINTALRELRESCYCDDIAREYGLRLPRCWRRVARGVRQKIRCRARITTIDDQFSACLAPESTASVG